MKAQSTIAFEPVAPLILILVPRKRLVEAETFKMEIQNQIRFRDNNVSLGRASMPAGPIVDFLNGVRIKNRESTHLNGEGSSSDRFEEMLVCTNGMPGDHIKADHWNDGHSLSAARS